MNKILNIITPIRIVTSTPTRTYDPNPAKFKSLTVYLLFIPIFKYTRS